MIQYLNTIKYEIIRKKNNTNWLPVRVSGIKYNASKMRNTSETHHRLIIYGYLLVCFIWIIYLPYIVTRMLLISSNSITNSK